MVDVAKLEAIVQDIKKLLPDGGEQFYLGLKNNVRVIVETVMNRMDLISRDEFDRQREILLRTRGKLAALEEKMTLLEAKLNDTDP